MQFRRRLLLPLPLAGLIERRPRTADAVAALLAGALAACGFQPLSLWPLTLLAVAALLELIARAPHWRAAFALGWCFGLGHFTVGNTWIATAFTYQANMPAWLGGIAVVLLALYLAMFPALAALGAWLLARPDLPSARARLPLALALAASWIVTEWMRGWVFTGFAWNPLGVALLGQFETRGLAIVTPWIGTYGLSGLTVLLAGMTSAGLRARQLAGVIPPVMLGTALTALMLLPDPWADRTEGAIRFTLVQPDLRQEIIDDPRHYEENFLRLARLSLPSDPGDKRVVFWPESGVGDYLRDGYPRYLYRLYTYAGDPVLARRRIGRVIGPYGLLLSGAVDLVMEGEDAVAARNSVIAIDGQGDVLAGYSKAHLVPYGEYLPMRALLEPLGAARLVAGSLDFRPGPGPRTFDFGTWGEAGVQVCYEIVFSGEVVDPENRPDYIFNPSNDGWFGAWGPPQHLAQARLRAIEEGLPVLRSTTTGISAVIDGQGIVRAFIGRHRAARIDGRIPPPREPTLFARHGNALPLVLAAVLAIAALSMVALERRRR